MLQAHLVSLPVLGLYFEGVAGRCRGCAFAINKMADKPNVWRSTPPRSGTPGFQLEFSGRQGGLFPGKILGFPWIRRRSPPRRITQYSSIRHATPNSEPDPIFSTLTAWARHRR